MNNVLSIQNGNFKEQLEEKENSHDGNLLSTSLAMLNSLELMHDIIQKANFIALNASIEAARTQSQTENFALVANQVRRQAERTDELARGLEKDIKLLLENAYRARAVNLTDIANDLIDKIDRNLFERNCDVQAWADFAEIVNCAKALAAPRSEINLNKEVDEKTKCHISGACLKLRTLTTIYQVYADSWLVNNNGVVIATARSPHLHGTKIDFDQYTCNTGKKSVCVTDPRHEKYLDNTLVVNYCCPVKDENGDGIGTIINHCNLNIVQEILEKMPIDSRTRLFVINKNGIVIAGPKGRGILSDHMHWLDAGLMAVDGLSGYTVECARNGQLSAWGFCHTFGYNSYPGKAWSGIVSTPVECFQNTFLCEEISRDTDMRRQASSIANDNLKKCSSCIQSRVSSINSINNETNMLAVNAAIQAGVAGPEGEAFSVIASEIGQLARQSEEFVNTINNLTNELGKCVQNTIYTRLGEAAFDCIDKIDRNLFERNCDVQAFASFPEIKNFQNIESIKEIMGLMRRMHDIYEVYHDIFLLDIDGNIIATAIHKELLGQNQADRNWFRECVTGNLVVTDLYFSRSISDHTVTFASPIANGDGNIIGVLTTRFNCQFIYDIMRSTIVGKGSDVYLVNSKGIVIGSPTGEGILEQTMGHLKGFRSAQHENYGYAIEEDPSLGKGIWAIGFAKTKGYLNYPGKGWSVLIRSEIESAQ